MGDPIVFSDLLTSNNDMVSSSSMNEIEECVQAKYRTVLNDEQIDVAARLAIIIDLFRVSQRYDHNRMVMKCALGLITKWFGLNDSSEHSKNLKHKRLWRDYVLLMEALDEPQSHLVAPVLVNFPLLMQQFVAADPNTPSNSQIHTQTLDSSSALVVPDVPLSLVLHAFTKAFSHMNGWVRLWCMQTYLDIVPVHVLVKHQCTALTFEQYIRYYNDVDLIDRLLNVRKLERFCERFLSHLQQLLVESSTTFWDRLLAVWLAHSWTPAAAYFLSDICGRLQPVVNVSLREDDLPKLTLVLKRLSHQQVPLIRAAAQANLLNMVAKHYTACGHNGVVDALLNSLSETDVATVITLLSQGSMTAGLNKVAQSWSKQPVMVEKDDTKQIAPVEQLLDRLDVCTDVSQLQSLLVPTLRDTLRSLIQQESHESSASTTTDCVCVRLLRAATCAVRDTRNADTYWPVLNAWLCVICDVSFVTALHLDDDVVECLKELCNGLLFDADANPSIAFMLSRQLYFTIRNNKHNEHFVHDWALDVMLRLAVFGTVLRRGERVHDYVIRRICMQQLPKSDHDQPTNQRLVVVPAATNERARTLAIRSLISYCDAQVIVSRVADLLPVVASDLIGPRCTLKKASLVGSNEADKRVQPTNNNCSSFGLSLSHRVQTRLAALWLALLHKVLTHDKAVDQVLLHNFCTRLFTDCINDLCASGQQTSVRLLRELTLVRLCISNVAETSFVDKLLAMETEIFQRRVGAICSLLIVLKHVAVHSQLNTDKQKSIFGRIFRTCLKWSTCMSLHVRCTALASLRALHDYATQHLQQQQTINDMIGLDVEAMKQMWLQDHDQSGAQHRAIALLLDDKYFMHFDVNKAFQLPYIFGCVPYLCGMPSDEQLTEPYWQWSAAENELDGQGCESMSSLSMLFVDEPQCEAQMAGWNSIWKGDTSTQGVLDIPSTSDIVDGGGKFQKKLMLPEDKQMTQSSTAHKHKGQVIVVASLINKPTNLGGLCRTCEIFGVDKLILCKKSIIEHNDFRSLSVAAENWMDIEEVRPDDLPNYLEQLRSSGFSIIGLEQTTDSHSLADFKFPLNTALVLGNEREGIPASLIGCLDATVEIEQFGVVRSLNVHVSAALIVYECVKQLRRT